MQFSMHKLETRKCISCVNKPKTRSSVICSKLFISIKMYSSYFCYENFTIIPKLIILFLVVRLDTNSYMCYVIKLQKRLYRLWIHK